MAQNVRAPKSATRPQFKSRQEMLRYYNNRVNGTNQPAPPKPGTNKVGSNSSWRNPKFVKPVRPVGGTGQPAPPKPGTNKAGQAGQVMTGQQYNQSHGRVPGLQNGGSQVTATKNNGQKFRVNNKGVQRENTALQAMTPGKAKKAAFLALRSHIQRRYERAAKLNSRNGGTPLTPGQQKKNFEGQLPGPGRNKKRRPGRVPRGVGPR
jgi:hypothetical protein